MQKLKNKSEFDNVFAKLFEFYPNIDDNDKENTIRNICHELHDLHDEEFCLSIYRMMVDTLKEKSVEREVLNAGVAYAKTLFGLGKTEQLGEVLEEILGYMEENIRNEDEITKGIKLELLVLKIQFLNIMKRAKESKKTYIIAHKLKEKSNHF